jgi:hypothetical protein
MRVAEKVFNPLHPPPHHPRMSRQDFVQVLSMFSNFGFAWPPAIKAIYSAFSILNFNVELLAPECSISISFETKWCA